MVHGCEESKFSVYSVYVFEQFPSCECQKTLESKMSELGDFALTEVGTSNGGYEDDTASLDSGDVTRNAEYAQLAKRHKKEATIYRKGPAPLEDEKVNGGLKESGYPGSLSTVPSKKDSEQSRAGSCALLSYFAKLGTAPDAELIDVEFVDSLIAGGGDINVTDEFGQTIMHEVVRNWRVEVADFCFQRFVDIDKPDNYGRTPLHLASAVNYPEMIDWLISHGGLLFLLFRATFLLERYLKQGRTSQWARARWPTNKKRPKEIFRRFIWFHMFLLHEFLNISYV